MRNHPFYRLWFVLMMVLAVFGSAAAQSAQVPGFSAESLIS